MSVPWRAFVSLRTYQSARTLQRHATAQVALARRGPGTPRSTSPENVVVQLAEMKEKRVSEMSSFKTLQLRIT